MFFHKVVTHLPDYMVRSSLYSLFNVSVSNSDLANTQCHIPEGQNILPASLPNPFIWKQRYVIV
jgi:hypothetical protein